MAHPGFRVPEFCSVKFPVQYRRFMARAGSLGKSCGHLRMIRPFPALARWLGTAWQEIPGGLQALCVTLWCIGFPLLGFGWWGDASGFWSSKPFLTNVFSSLTAVAFGVPFAVIVLGRVGVAQAELVEARAAQRLAARVSEDFLSAARRLLRGPPISLQEAGTGLASAEATAQEAIRRWESARNDDSLRDLRALITSGALDTALENFRQAVVPGRSAISLVADISIQWSFLNGAVRSRLLESGGSWIAPFEAAQADEMVRRVARDPYMDGWLRDTDMALRRFSTTLAQSADMSAALHDLWTQLEIGAETIEAISRLPELAAEAARVLGHPRGTGKAAAPGGLSGPRCKSCGGSCARHCSARPGRWHIPPCCRKWPVRRPKRPPR
jgi:hypothetical protein